MLLVRRSFAVLVLLAVAAACSPSWYVSEPQCSVLCGGETRVCDWHDGVCVCQVDGRCVSSADAGGQ